MGLTPHPDGCGLGRPRMENGDRPLRLSPSAMDINPLLTNRRGSLHLRRFPGPPGHTGHGHAGLGRIRPGRRAPGLRPGAPAPLCRRSTPTERDICGQGAANRGVRVPLRHQHRRGGGCARCGEVRHPACPMWPWPTEFIFTCSTDSQEKMAQTIKDHDRLNRVVVASCSPAHPRGLCSRRPCAGPGSTPICSRWPISVISAPGCTRTGPSRRPRPKPRTWCACPISRAATAGSPCTSFPSPVTQAALVVGGGAAGHHREP